MKITNILQFSENHSFYTTSHFSLSPMGYKVLRQIYQPMVGAFAISLYELLYQLVPAECIGCSRIEQQRLLFLSLGLEPSDKGKKYFIDQTSKLEAVGLLQTARIYQASMDEYIYEYELIEPLSLDEFFNSQHLSLLLRDKVGKHMLRHIRQQFAYGETHLHNIEHLEKEQLSVPFYDIFRLNPSAIDEELERASNEAAAAIAHKRQRKSKMKGFEFAEILMRFPKDSPNRAFVEKLEQRADQLELINYVVNKYDLTLQETSRLLDEDGIFTADGELEIEQLQYIANLNFRHDKKRSDDRERFLHKLTKSRPSDPLSEQVVEITEKSVDKRYYLDIPDMFQGQCDIDQYNMMLINDPYTKVLERFFPGSIPEPILNMFERIDINYKLSEEVINVLIHYLKAFNLSWNRAFVESIASDMLGKEVNSYESAVMYIRERTDSKHKQKQQGNSKWAAAPRGRSGKPNIPIISETVTDPSADVPLTQEEMAEIQQIVAQLNAQDR